MIGIPYYIFETVIKGEYEIVFYQKVGNKDGRGEKWGIKSTGISFKIKVGEEREIQLRFERIDGKLIPNSETLDIKSLNIKLKINLKNHEDDYTMNKDGSAKELHTKMDIEFYQDPIEKDAV